MIFRRGFFTAFFIVTIAISGCGMGGDSNDRLLQRAEENITQGALKAAELDLKAVLKREPSDRLARRLLGHVYIEQEDGASAEKELRLSLAGEADSDDIMPLLASALLLQGDYQRVLELNLVTKSGSSAWMNMMVSRGLALISVNPSRAGVELQQVLEYDEQYPEALYGLALLAAVEGKQEEARVLLSQLLEIDAQHGKGWGLLGFIEYVNRDLQAAVRAYTEAIKYRHVSYVEQLKLALVRIDLGQLEQAQGDLQRLRQTLKEHPELSYVQGRIDYLREDYHKAAAAFEQVVRVDEGHYPALLNLGASHFMLGNYQMAERYLSKYRVSNPSNLPVRKLLAAIKMKDSNYDEAEAIARTIIAQGQGDVYVMALLGNALLSKNLHDPAVAAYREAVTMQPELTSSRINLGLGLIQSGDLEAGIAELETALELDPGNMDASTKLILTHLKSNSFDKALAAAVNFRDQHPAHTTPYTLMGMVFMAKNDLDSAFKAFENVVALEPGNTSGNSGLATISVGRNQLTQAERYYRTALETHPGDLKTLMNMAQLASSQSDDDAYITALETAVSYNPDAVQPRKLLARVYIDKANPEQALKLLSVIDAKFPKDPQLLTLLAEAQLQSGSVDAAQYTLGRFIDLYPQDVSAHYSLASIARQRRDAKGYRRYLDKTLVLDSTHINARKSLVDLLLEEEQFDEADTHIEKLFQLVGQRSDVMVLDGRRELGQGNSDRAISRFRQAFNQTKNNFNLLRLSSALWDTGKTSEALSLLEKWRQKHLDDTIIRFELANRYLSSKRFNQAIKEFRVVVERAPNNALALNNLAWLLRAASPAEAADLASRGLKIFPQSAELNDTYAMVLLEQGKIDEARRVIDKAKYLNASNPTITYHRALILEGGGDLEAAERELNNLLQVNESFSYRADAENLLRRIESRRLDAS